jgi:hypothetical protein
MSYTIVSWHTPDYAECSARLVASLERHGYTNHVEYQVEPCGLWKANVCMKPQIINQAMSDIGGDIVYLDADAVVHDRLTLFDEWYGNGVPNDIGVQYLRDTEPMHDFLDQVALLMARCALVWQQAAQIMLTKRLDLQVKRLPASYTRIFDAPDMASVTPVIEHMQHSRRVQH